MPLSDLLEITIQNLKNEAEQLSIDGEDVLKNNSYSNESTGFNLVEDYELTPHYEQILNEIEELINLLNV